jgi:hypothetical protein
MRQESGRGACPRPTRTESPRESLCVARAGAHAPRRPVWKRAPQAVEGRDGGTSRGRRITPPPAPPRGSPGPYPSTNTHLPPLSPYSRPDLSPGPAGPACTDRRPLPVGPARQDHSPRRSPSPSPRPTPPAPRSPPHTTSPSQPRPPRGPGRPPLAARRGPGCGGRAARAVRRRTQVGAAGPAWGRSVCVALDSLVRLLGPRGRLVSSYSSHPTPHLISQPGPPSDGLHTPPAPAHPPAPLTGPSQPPRSLGPARTDCRPRPRPGPGRRLC